MPFLAMKIDASLLNLKHRANRRPKNTQLVSKNWKVIPMMADYLSIDLSEILFSSNWKCESIKLMQTKVMIASSQRLGMPRSFTSGITSSISVPSKRSNVIWKTSLKNISFSLLSLIRPNMTPIMGTKASHTYISQTEGTQVMRLSLHTTINQRVKNGI